MAEEQFVWSFRRLNERLTEALEGLDAPALRGVVQGLAHDCRPGQRAAFVQRVMELADEAPKASPATGEPGVHARARDLTREVRAIAEAPENAPSLAPDWDDEDPLGPFDVLVPWAEDLMEQAAAALERGGAAEAAAAYAELFSAFQIEDDYGRGLAPEGFDIEVLREHAARYLRAVYLGAAPAGRAEALLAAGRQLAASGLVIPLRQVAEVGADDPPDWGQALDALLTLLGDDTDSLADAWVREATAYRHGAPGLAGLARQQRPLRPAAWLDWIVYERERGEDAAAVEACMSGLERFVPARALLVALMVDAAAPAAERSGRPDTLRDMRFAALIADPCVERLIELWEACQDDPQRAERLEQAAAMLVSDDGVTEGRSPRPDETVAQGVLWRATQPGGVDSRKLAALCWAMIGWWEKARALAEQDDYPGWSGADNARGTVLAQALLSLAGGDPARAGDAVVRLWRWQLPVMGARSRYWDRGTVTAAPLWAVSAEVDEQAVLASLEHRLDSAVAEAGARWPLAPEQRRDWLRWCLQTAGHRAHAIVSNKQRGAYERAANALAACLEAAVAVGEQDEAEVYIEDIRRRYSRYPAFQRALREALPDD